MCDNALESFSRSIPHCSTEKCIMAWGEKQVKYYCFSAFEAYDRKDSFSFYYC